MTLEREAAPELFGLGGTFPRPGWVVLDAAREHRFTGELVFDVLPEVRAYLDRGEIYLAERRSDPSLGARLVDAGALNAAQLELGAMRIGDAEHLGRLFERVPSVDRHAVLVTTEMMNDACVAWLARQHVRGVVTEPYHRHVSGIHRWDRPSTDLGLSAGDPLPAPPSTAAPIELAPPEPIFDDLNFSDGLVEWNEPSWLDERSTAWSDTTVTTQPDHDAEPTRREAGRSFDSDWIDMLATEGLPDPGDDPLASPVSLPSPSAPSPDRFEIIWPSGEVDEEFGLTESVDREHHPDQDRAGPTARIGGFDGLDRPVAPLVAVADRHGWPPSKPAIVPDEWAFESTRPSSSAPVDLVPGDIAREADVDGRDVADDVADDVVLAVRRAVASIETGSLAARRRLAANSSSAPTASVPPERNTAKAARPVDGAIETLDRRPAGRSVFDEDSPTDLSSTESRAETPHSTSTHPGDRAAEPARVSALRRLIGGLRRR